MFDFVQLYIVQGKRICHVKTITQVVPKINWQIVSPQQPILESLVNLIFHLHPKLKKG
jgi:hypothetical protein